MYNVYPFQCGLFSQNILSVENLQMISLSVLLLLFFISIFTNWNHKGVELWWYKSYRSIPFIIKWTLQTHGSEQWASNCTNIIISSRRYNPWNLKQIRQEFFHWDVLNKPKRTGILLHSWAYALDAVRPNEWIRFFFYTHRTNSQHSTLVLIL